MKTITSRRGKAGFVSYFLVLSTGVIMTLLMLYSYKRAAAAQTLQSQVQMRTDYGEKEDAILRSIVAITPNRAIRAMQGGSSASTTVSDPLRWQNIFTESLVLANARTAIQTDVQGSLKSSLGVTELRTGNSGNSALATPSKIFKAISPENGLVSVGINRSLGAGFPPQLTTTNTTITSATAGDKIFPLISHEKTAAGLTAGTYPNFSRLKYPQINFGYAKPGDDFVARRNWWAFSMDVSAEDRTATRVVRPGRDFILSIYEIPSQLAISAASFMSLGQYASGDAWQNVTINGGVFGGKVQVEGETSLPALASRRGMALSGDATVGGQSFASKPFAPGIREEHYRLTQGAFFPVSLASESGRVAFVAINRGADYFDRFSNAAESNVLSPTTWNNYSIGALQCAMRLDITQCVSATNNAPTNLRFSYLKGGVRKNLDISLVSSGVTGLPVGYLPACAELATYNFGAAVVDVAYGGSGKALVSTGPDVRAYTTAFAYQSGVTGSVTFNNARFGDPLVEVKKYGYYKPSYPFEVKTLTSGKTCIAIYPQRFANFLASINADTAAVNNSLLVNVDYTTATGSILLSKPSIPCTDIDYGVILQECANLTDFTKGFSLVTNLRTYIGDDFNIVQATPPTGYIPASGQFFPPCSLFTPEKRYGVEVDPFAVSLGGQVGSLASETATSPVRPLDSKNLSGNAIAADKITVNLRPITHPAELPPITMMNWLVTLEERRKQFVSY